VVTSTMESSGMESSAHGGVGHLLRMAKTQCGVAVAFAALRKADGGFAIATFPNLANDPAWTIEAIDELVRQTWEDPVLGGGKVIVRSGRVLRGMWTGQAHHTKMAVAALSDPDLPERPWGLLCMAEPLAGHFEQDELNLLHNLALRLTSYLRARQEVLEGSFAPAATAPPANARQLINDTPVVVQRLDQVEWTPIEPLSLAEPDPASFLTDGEPAAPSPDLRFDQEPTPSAAPAPEPPEPPEPLAGDWALSGASAGEWVEAEPVPPGGPIGGFAQDPLLQGAPTQDISPLEDLSPLPHLASFDDPAGPADAAPDLPPVGSWASEGEPRRAEAAPAAPPAEPETGDGLRSLLGPDPVTGLATLPTLLGRLAESLVHVRNHEGSVAVVLLDVTSDFQPGPLSDPALHAVAGRLTNRVRENDLVARVDANLFAVLAHVRQDGIDADTMRSRMVDAVVARADSSAGVLTARSAIAAAAPGDAISAEQLLRDAAESLGSP
jgi:GGDEF domain-containing protein